MDNSKFLKSVIIILLLINIGTLTFLWFHHSPHEHPHSNPGVAEFLIHELKLNDKQQEQFEQLRNDHHHAIEQLQEQGHQLHHHFFDLLHTSPVDSSAVEHAASAIAENQKQIELVTFYHFQKLRTICNSEQQHKFDEVIQDALRMMAPKPPGPQGR